MNSRDSACYIGVDLGTSGCRAIAINRDGALVASSTASLPAPERENSHCEQEPSLWWESVCIVLAGVLEQIPTRNISAIAVDGTSGTVFMIDDHGNPLAPALMYDDARSQTEATRISAIAPDSSAAHGAASGLAKLLYLQQQPYASRAEYMVHQADWISGRLCGSFGTSDENNCLKLGYDAIHRQWPEWFKPLGVRTKLLPRVVVAGTCIGTIDKTIGDQLGLRTNTKIIAGTTDGVAAFLATGAHTIGDGVTSLGSTLVLKVLSDKPVFSPSHGVYSHRLGNRWLAGGASNCGGKVLLQYFTQQQLDQMTPLLRPERTTGLDYYPLPAQGERFPYNDPAMLPRLSPRPTDDVLFFQGILEGIALIEADGYHLLASHGAPYPTTIRSVGRGAHNQAWTEIRGKLLNVQMQSAIQEQAAYGTALLARNACLDDPSTGRLP